ncbi:hypothetical protein ENUP19_0036G0061 [Entamoeba nuttalli]|uniref:SPIN90/Ldb17 leucine-rich domain-containing protein n=2 Tax=Entamoeba nuttalli TaxID=412467 RepID=K2I0L0_ENTNP|nr:hypothetical protein ENU1_025930 [Entamoeba nuttalli P19]EKE42295.1 hypothetical protein ENU1_025930 [Entamoeba nuttalli P19]|eukprot:XP_008855371.1 hypothetical protein ENU1_025930 [Entamoeba nuttalli P19]
MQWIKSVYNDIVSTELDDGPKVEELFETLTTAEDKTTIIYDIYSSSHTNHSVFLQHLNQLTELLKNADVKTDSQMIKFICLILKEITTKPRNTDGFEEELLVEGIYKELPNFDYVLCSKLDGMKDIQTIQTILSTITYFLKTYKSYAKFTCFFEMSQLYPLFIQNLPNSYMHNDIAMFLTTICKDNQELQKLLVFNGIFDVIFQAFAEAQYIKNPRKIVLYFDLLKVLLDNNNQNEYNFRELNYGKSLLKFFDDVKPQTVADLQDDQLECIIHIYSVLELFFNSNLPSYKINQKYFVSLGLLEIIGSLSLSDIPYPPSFLLFLKTVCLLNYL